MDYPLDNGISWPLNQWPDLGYGLQLPALTELTALVRSLGGHIFAPGLETYADQAALNPAASALDSQVGYVGSASTQGLGENLLLNSSFTGASVGSPGSRGSGWAAFSGANGLSISVTQASPNSITLRVNGTATASGVLSFLSNAGAGLDTPAFPGQLFSAQAKLTLSGTYSGAAVRFTLAELGATHNWLSNTKEIFNPTSGQVSIAAGRVGNANTQFVYVTVNYAYTLNEVVDFYVTVENPQIERGHPTSYTPTYGTAISRGVFASAAQGTLANTPKLVTLGNARGLEFDGSTDHLVTDITTPSSGYVCVAFRQDEAIGGFNALIGSAHSPINKGVRLAVTTSGYPNLTVFDGSGSTSSAQINAAITPGVTYVMDASFTPTSQVIRLNGANEIVGVTPRNPVGDSIFLIGASNGASAGGVTINALMQGAFGLVIIIPNVTLPAATEQRIRKLVGQIYGVQTQ